MTRYFCSYFDKNYLSRGLTLYDSIGRHCPDFHWYVLCLDDATYGYLTGRALANVTVISRSALEHFDPQLAATRGTRSLIEYYFTTTASWLRYVFEHTPVDLLTYVDADFRFFASPEPAFDELGHRSIGIVEHRYPSRLAHKTKYGRFNVGWLTFRRDEQGLACIAWWRERCIEWCYDRLEGDRFADQKYLDQWPRLFSQLAVLEHKGITVAPWNLESARIEAGASGTVRIETQPLICFHYHGLKHLIGPLYESGLRHYRVPLDRKLRRLLFAPYLRELLAHERILAAAGVTDGNATSIRWMGGWLGGLRMGVRAAAAVVGQSALWARRA